MHVLGRRMKRETLARFVGRRLPILVEGPYGDSAGGEWFGYTPNYLPVRIDADEMEEPTNRILDVRLVDCKINIDVYNLSIFILKS